MPNNRRKLLWISLLALIAIVMSVVLTPVFLIMPFKAQTSRILEVSYVMRRWSPIVTVLGSLLILTLTIRLWLGGRWWSRMVLVMGVTVDGKSVAYPLPVLQKHSPIIDVVGSTAIVVVLGEDRRSVRAFERTI